MTAYVWNYTSTIQAINPSNTSLLDTSALSPGWGFHSAPAGGSRVAPYQAPASSSYLGRLGHDVTFVYLQLIVENIEF